jgi:hypothetical protein
VGRVRALRVRAMTDLFIRDPGCEDTLFNNLLLVVRGKA